MFEKINNVTKLTGILTVVFLSITVFLSLVYDSNDNTGFMNLVGVGVFVFGIFFVVIMGGFIGTLLDNLKSDD